MVLGPAALKEHARAITHVALALLRIHHRAWAEALANLAQPNPLIVRKDAKNDNATGIVRIWESVVTRSLCVYPKSPIGGQERHG